MLSYRHGFHAGNHADVLKHLTLSLLLQSLLKKEKPFFFMDTHGGAGRYVLNAEWALKNKEFESGIGRIWQRSSLPDGLSPYLEAVRTTNPGSLLRWYPGSPRIARHFLRPQDRMVVAELHPKESRELEREFEGDRQVKVEALDGYQSLKAHLPPKERRGLIHIDPAYELKDERRRVLEALLDATRRWATGIFAVWYPIQDGATRDEFLKRVEKLKIPRTLVVELMVRPEEAFQLNGSGMILVNPPWQIDEELISLLPFLSDLLGEGGQGSWHLQWLNGELPAA
jgi:23S rRNA (adenine2030-N6)-methyltransferase